jgi:hypothetical protein
MGAIAAGDLFTVEAVSPFGLIRYYVFFVLDLATRHVHIGGITRQPTEAWMQQIGRNLTDVEAGFLNGIRYLILDRDPLYTKAFRRLFDGAGTHVLRLPARSPNLNVYAERFVRSIRSECLDRVISLGEKHLRVLVSEYVEHYHSERNHQGLGNRLLRPLAANTNAGEGPVKRRRRLGGLLSYYYREAA